VRGKKLTVTRQPTGDILINFNPRVPPHVLFDTNVLIGLNPDGINALNILSSRRGFCYRYSMLNFVELASHMGDGPSDKTSAPFRKYQAAFGKIASYFDPKPLLSAETVFMKAVGLYHYLGPKWMIDEEGIANTVNVIAEARDLIQLREQGFSPEHYKELRRSDGEWFLKFLGQANEIGRLPDGSDDWRRWLRRFYSYLIYRASSQKKTLDTLGLGEQKRVIRFFDGQGGKMFLTHFKHLLLKTLRDHRKEDTNDFYDMLQLLLLRDENLLFVTDDRPFHQYYLGAERHRVVEWKGFRASAAVA